AARYLGAQADDIAMTDSTSMGLGTIYGGLVLQDKQEILTTTHDHIVTHLSLQLRADRTGVAMRKVALYEDPAKASVDEITTKLAKAITPATRVIALTWVHSGTGVKLPIRELANVVARANANRSEADRAVLFVDGVHGFGNQAERAADLGCDFFIAGCHKWIFGPRGTGLAWARRPAWSITKPTIPTFDPMWRPEPLDKLPPAAWMTPGGFHSFEHRWALAQAFELHEQIGRDKIAKRIAELNTRCKDGLAKISRVKVVTPRSAQLSAGIICFSVEGKTPEQVVAGLRSHRVVASVTPSFYDPMYARLAPSLLTLEDDVDRAVAAVAAVAG
ncbi:MAG TPA: aminotransferase class V-fold PLP-dependent enzyme, partial [Kofleriaceae bacterium]